MFPWKQTGAHTEFMTGEFIRWSYVKIRYVKSDYKTRLKLISIISRELRNEESELFPKQKYNL